MMCCFLEPNGPWWLTLAVFDLFALVCLVSFILYRHFEHRDAINRRTVEAYAQARTRFMDAAEQYWRNRHPDVRAAVAEMVLLGNESIQAFQRAQTVIPDFEPDGNWNATLLWVQQKAGLLRLPGSGP
jgi:AcrR family transcriptional regulator